MRSSRGRAHPAAWVISDDDLVTIARGCDVRRGSRTVRTDGKEYFCVYHTPRRGRRAVDGRPGDRRRRRAFGRICCSRLLSDIFSKRRHVSNCVCMGKLCVWVDGLFLFRLGELYKETKRSPRAARFCFKKKMKTEDDDDEEKDGRLTNDCCFYAPAQSHGN